MSEVNKKAQKENTRVRCTDFQLSEEKVKRDKEGWGKGAGQRYKL